MKRVIALLLAVSLTLSACAQPLKPGEETKHNNVTGTEIITPDNSNTSDSIGTDTSQSSTTTNEANISLPEFTDLSDATLLRYVEDSVYADIVTALNSEDYFVENVNAIYISKEYLDELDYNSQENIYFGYTLSELNSYFEGTRYVFTLDENDETTVKKFESYDDTFDKVEKNVAVGSGVILLCVTVSVATGGIAPAMSVVFAGSAKTATALALSGGVFSGVVSGIVAGVETKDFEEALKAAALTGSESFKWGAITGAITGGATAAINLKGATLNGLTMNEAARIQKESKYPLDVIKQIKSMDNYQVYKNATPKTQMVDGKLALVREIDLDFISELDERKVTNLVRMQEGYSPIEPLTGKAYELHHVAQRQNGTLAILTKAEHQGNSGILHIAGKKSEIDRVAFKPVRERFWKDFANQISK